MRTVHVVPNEEDGNDEGQERESGDEGSPSPYFDNEFRGKLKLGHGAVWACVAVFDTSIIWPFISFHAAKR